MSLSDLVGKARRLLHQQDGPLTQDLARHPGRFGLGQLPERLMPDATTTTVCGYCSTGCGLRVHLRDGEAIGLSPDTDYPVNLGMACPKGWESLTPLAAPDRAVTPLLRDGAGQLAPVTWTEAMARFKDRFQSIRDRQGPDSLAFLSTGQIPTEEMAFLGSLARFGMGIRHGDGNTRQCMATAVTAYKECFGFDAPPYSYRDYEESDVILLVGSNLCIAHPIQWERICRNPHDPEIIVVDPRRTETAMAATRHVALTPKSDLPLFYAVAQVLIEREWIDREFIAAHTEGFGDFAKHVAAYRPEAVSERTGLSVEAIEELAESIHRGKRVSIWWTMGINQGHEATRTAQALIALSLMTGNIGRPGTGANSITGQCNAMGSRLFSNTSSLLGGRSFEDPQDRADVSGLLGLDPKQIPTDKGMAYDQVVDAITDGRIRGLWIIATNGAHSWSDQKEFLAALDTLEFLVVQDLYADTETAKRADLVLPAAGWGEKEGTFINSERRIGVTKKVRRAPGQALSDFNIFRLVAEAWGCREPFDCWKSPEDVFDTLKALSKGRPCDFSAIECYRQIDAAGGIQWPFVESEESVESERRLFEDGVFYRESGKALFCFEATRAIPDEVNEAHPLVLLTGRGSSSQWHTQTRTGRSAVLNKLAPKGIYVEVHPADARPLAIETGEIVRVRSRRGVLEARAVVTAAVGRGRVFVPMHYVETNRLTPDVVDPYSRQPSYKYTAVRLEKTR